MHTLKSTAAVAVAFAGLLTAGQAFAQTTPLTTPAGIDPVTGARPGNVIGTNNSLPLSNNSSNAGPSDTRSLIAPRLPAPDIADNSSPRDFLIAARNALAGNRTGEAQEALERAESRALAGNVLASQLDEPSRQRMVRSISTARESLSRGDKAGTIQNIDEALKL
jgi:hypothetical protein